MLVYSVIRGSEVNHGIRIQREQGMLVYSDVRGSEVNHRIRIKREKGLLAYSIHGVFSLLWI